MKVTITYTPKDMYEAQKTYYKSTKKKYLIIFFALLLLLLSAGKLTIDQSLNLDTLLLLILALIFILYPQTILRIISYRAYKTNARWLSSPTEFEFNERGMKIVNKMGNSQQNWESFQKFVVNNKILLICPTPQIFHMIPKRFFETEDVWNTVIELAKNKIGK
ncbi:MAG: YcxB family protein [Gammaproteobacteria bacterium]|nr:YcxB family protein [Gammaproteobacteria bacterium]